MLRGLSFLALPNFVGVGGVGNKSRAKAIVGKGMDTYIMEKWGNAMRYDALVFMHCVLLVVGGFSWMDG